MHSIKQLKVKISLKSAELKIKINRAESFESTSIIQMIPMTVLHFRLLI